MSVPNLCALRYSQKNSLILSSILPAALPRRSGTSTASSRPLLGAWFLTSLENTYGAAKGNGPNPSDVKRLRKAVDEVERKDE